MCGILAIYDLKNNDIAEIACGGLLMLNHRGQESAGMTGFTAKGELHYFRSMGEVKEVFSLAGEMERQRTENVFKSLKGGKIIGHVRYSTAGGSKLVNAQPQIFSFQRDREFALAHNGQLVNKEELIRKCVKMKYCFQGDSDTELIGALISLSAKKDFLEAIIDSLKQLKGSFVLAILFEGNIFIVRDSFGVRPVSLAKNEYRYIAASESCVFNCLETEFARDVKPGELVIINDKGFESVIWDDKPDMKFCIFELIYYARPDSVFFENLRVNEYHRKLGEYLAQEYSIAADIVVPVMDSGLYGAQGYSQISGIPLEFAIVRNKYISRTFIKPNSHKRKLAQVLKHNIIPELIRGKRIIVVDDSLVRGDTSCDRNARLRRCGAKEIHECLTCPPIKFPCFYGIDMKTKEELAAGHMSVEEIRQKIGVDSLNYLSYESMMKATGLPENNFCTACFNGKYPIAIE